MRPKSSAGLKSEARIGPRAYLSPGGAFAGGTLARDVVFSVAARPGARRGDPPAVVGQVQQRRAPALGRAAACAAARGRGRTNGRGVGTDLQAWHRHAAAIERRRAVPLAARAGRARCARTIRPCRRCRRTSRAPLRWPTMPLDAAGGASALVVATPWPEYRQLSADQMSARG